MWIDSHAHLYEYSDSELRTLLDEAQLHSVSQIVSTAVSIETAHIVDHQSNTFDEVWGAVGISPFDICNLNTTWISELSSFLSNNKIVAIGEIGIDGSNPLYPPIDQQRPVFETQLKLAASYNLPVIIHSRGVELEALELCCRNNLNKAVFHCFTGNRESLQAILNEGYIVSLSGMITFKNATIRDLISIIPLEQLLIETDSPYLTPVPFRGKKNNPSMVRFVGEAIAAIHNVDPIVIAGQIKKNFDNLIMKSS